ncbi:MAG: hypothetical protein J0H69_04845 [Burkholderiales bacterium]|nr:hypothetical protein [Burkholderiales bacterium]
MYTPPTIQQHGQLRTIPAQDTMTTQVSTPASRGQSVCDPVSAYLPSRDVTRKRRHSDDETFQVSDTPDPAPFLDASQTDELAKLIGSIRPALATADGGLERIRRLIATAIHRDSLPDAITGQLICALPDLQDGNTAGLLPLLDSLAAYLPAAVSRGQETAAAASSGQVRPAEDQRPRQNNNPIMQAAVKVFLEGGALLSAKNFTRELRANCQCTEKTAGEYFKRLRALFTGGDSQLVGACQALAENPAKTNEELSRASTRHGAPEIPMEEFSRARSIMLELSRQGVVQVEGLGTGLAPNIQRRTRLLDDYFQHSDLGRDDWARRVSAPGFGISPPITESSAANLFGEFGVLRNEVEKRRSGRSGTSVLARVLDVLFERPELAVDSPESIQQIHDALTRRGVSCKRMRLAHLLRQCLYAIATDKITLPAANGAAASSPR